MNLSPIQIQIGKLLAEGMREKEIAEAMKRPYTEIKGNKQLALKASGSKSSAEYVFKLVKAGLI